MQLFTDITIYLLVILYFNRSNSILNQVIFRRSPFTCTIRSFFAFWGTLLPLRVANINLQIHDFEHSWTDTFTEKRLPRFWKMFYLTMKIYFGIKIFMKHKWCQGKRCGRGLSVGNDLKWVSVGFIRIWTTTDDEFVIHVIHGVLAKIAAFKISTYSL